MDTQTELEKLKEYLGVAIPEKAGQFRLVDNSNGDTVLYDLLPSNDVKYVTPQVWRNSDADPSIAQYRAMFHLINAMRFHDNQWHAFMYGQQDWKGGMYVYAFTPTVYAIPEAGVDEMSKEMESGWMIPYSAQTKRYACEQVGKVFVTQMTLRGIGKDGRASVENTVYYLEVYEGKRVMAQGDADNALEGGFYRFEEVWNPDTSEKVVNYTEVDKSDYDAAKALSAGLLSFENTVVDGQLSERQQAERYLEIVAQDDAKEIEILDGADFNEYPLIHISKDDIPKFTPFVSTRTLAGGDENRTVPRVCVTHYVANSMIAKGTLRHDYGHKPYEQGWPMMKIYGLRAPLVFRPSGKLVADGPSTDELWLLRYNETTQHYLPDYQGEFFAASLTFAPIATDDLPALERVEWYVNVLGGKQILWCKDCPLPAGYYHITEERQVVDGQPRIRYVKRIITADAYLERKDKLTNVPKKETSPSGGW